MRNESRSSLATLMAAAALGAALMYLLDPDKGRRRRAVARDRAASALRRAGNFAGTAGRDLAHRIDGLRASMRRASDGEHDLDDLRLIERVRSRIGRVVSHPHAIHVGALRGRVTVSGTVLLSEARPLLAAVRSVPGVDSVDDHLVAFERAGSISSLQGTPARRDRRRNWTPALRAGAMAAGAALALRGLRGRTLARLALAGAGLLLGARGATNATLLGERESP